jgi:hypothetical protein
MADAIVLNKALHHLHISQMTTENALDPGEYIAGRGHVSDARRFSTALGPGSEFACAARAVPFGGMAAAWIPEDRDRDQRRSVVHRFAYIIVSRLIALPLDSPAF